MDRRIAIAPMIDCTDRHCRYFLRLISRHVLLYTEMITAKALLHGDTHRFLSHDPAEHPVAFQLGGSDPRELAVCAKKVEEAGFDEVNLNVGCPSDRVQSGMFGACLMAHPDLVADCIAAMKSSVKIPVTVKTRIGIDDRDSYEHLHDFVAKVSHAGCQVFIIHARKAWLKGLSPKENREIPPLRYDIAAMLKQDFPHLTIILNGGINTLDEIATHLTTFDGVMIGRAAYSNPYLLSDFDQRFYHATHPIPTREEILANLQPYIEKHTRSGIYAKSITRHILGLYQGQPGARAWRRKLSTES